MNRKLFTKLAQKIGTPVANPAADRARAQDILKQDPEKWKQYVAAKRGLYNQRNPNWWQRNVVNPARQVGGFMKGLGQAAVSADDWHDTIENNSRVALGAMNNLAQVGINAARLPSSLIARVAGGRDYRDAVNDQFAQMSNKVDNYFKSKRGKYRNSSLENSAVNNFLVDTAADQVAAVPLAAAGGALTKVINPALARAASPVMSKVAPAVQKARQASKLVNYGAKATGLMTKGLGATSTGNMIMATAADPLIRRRVFGTDKTDMSAMPMRGFLNMTPLALPVRAGMYLNDASYGMEAGSSDYGSRPVYEPSQNSQMDYFVDQDENGNPYYIPYSTVKSVTRDKSGRQMMTMTNGDTIPIPAGYKTFSPGDQIIPGMEVGASPIGEGAARSNVLNSFMTGMNPVPIVDAYDAYVAAKNDNYNNDGTVPAGIPLTDAAVIGASAFIPQLGKLRRLGKLGTRVATGAVQGGQMAYYPYFRPRMLESMYGVSPEYSGKEEFNTLLSGAKYLPGYLWDKVTGRRYDDSDEF